LKFDRIKIQELAKPKLKRIQEYIKNMVILTISDTEKDILDTYKLQASGYINKPVTLEEFQVIMKRIEAYWFVLCKRPPKYIVTEYV
ncbi:MAG: hypothetical protein P8105_13560, partial [Dehalococcoidia bacterium]